MLSLTARGLLLNGAAVIAVQAGTAQTTVPPPVAAQDIPQQGPAAATSAPATAAQASPAEAQPGEIVVTGSRIARPDFAAPNPIVSLNAANIQQSGETNLTDFLQRVPALTNSLDSTQTANASTSYRLTNPYGGAGANELDLRGLGTQRTLVLVDGRRHVAGQFGTAAVDINAIPTDLVERVDVLTAGASAVYGADGVSGVVNFILKRDFNGISARVQSGISEHGDGANRLASIIAGRNFADGRGNVTLSYEYGHDGALANDDRTYLQQSQRQYVIDNDNYRGPGTGTYQKVLQGDLRYPGESPFGAIDINGDYVPDFRGDGAPYNSGRPVSYYATGGDSTPVAGFVGNLLPKIERHAVNLLSHYDFSDAAKLSVEGKFVQVTATTFDSPSGDYPAALSIDNPFMPESIRAAALAANEDTVYETRDNFDFPNKGESDRRRTYRGVVDLSGRISDHATYDIYYTYGETDERIDKLNDRWNDRMLAALDVVTGPDGKPTCRSNLEPSTLATPAISFTPGPNSGCVPLNLFGAGTASPAAVAWVTNQDNRSYAAITQQVVDGSISGDFGQFFKLPGGPLAFALGGEWRRETSRFTPDAFLTDKQWYQYDEGNSFDPTFIIAPEHGSFDVAEAFGELDAPILKDRPWAETLSVGAAGRYSHYSTIGSTSAWQFNGVYAPVHAIGFRGSYGRSVRAPNIGELFQPTTGTSSFFDDPCYLTNRNSGTQYRAANCTALVNAAGGDNGAFTGANNPNSVSFISGSQSGNANLQAETARTWTAGVVLRPSFVRGLTVAVDWYDIRLKGAINLPDAQTVANLCVDQPTLNNVFCGEISRQQGGTGAGYINGFAISPQNVSNFRTAGLDLNINYLLRTQRAGIFDLRFIGGYLNRLDIIQTPGATVENDVDQVGRPKFDFVFSPTWTVGPVTVSYNLRWHDAERRFARTETDNNPDFIAPDLFRYKALWEHDLQIDLAVSRRFDFYVGVNNLTDQLPDVDTYNQPISPLGRFAYAGVKLRL